MMNIINKMLSKSRFVCLTSLLLATNIVSPLTSCGSDGSSNDIGGFDKEFGFDAHTYNRLENEFKIKYKNQLLDDNNIDKNVAFDKYDNFLQNDITSIRNQLFDPAKNYSFTIRTNTLMDYAAKNYNIYLNRNTSIGETDFDNLKQSSLENFIIYLDNVYGIDSDEKENQITNFSDKFNQLLSEIKPKYADNAQILLHLRASVINCWENLDKEFALLAASNHLRDFFDEYQFTIKDQSDKQTDSNELLWDNLLYNEQFINNGKIGLIDQDINCSISNQWINMLFTISKKKKYSENDSTDQQDESTSDILLGYKEITDFNSQEIIPGYILTPVLKTMSQDIYANQYYMSIDWQLISNKYKDETNQEIRNKVSAHIAYNKDGQLANDFGKGYLSSDNFQFVKYSLLATPTYQSDNLVKAYFDVLKDKGEKITFSWDKQKIGIDSFLPSNAYDNDFVLPKESYTLEMSQDNLSKMGLQLNGTNLSDLLDKQKKSQDNQSVDNTNKPDANLKIEEKFVKYCTISAISTVKFVNDWNNNNIQNIFTATYSNTQQECEISNKPKETELNDIGTSLTFNDNAKHFYDNVAKYINTQEIADKFIVSDNTSNIIEIELWILGVIAIIWFISLIYQKLNTPSDANLLLIKGPKIAHPFVLLIVFFVLVITLAMTWKYFVYRPLHESLTGIKNWNDEFANGLANKINVVKNVINDKQYFSTSNDFSKYFHANGSKAFAKYFYYFHFNGLLSKTDETSIGSIINEEVRDDYKQFNNTKNKFIKDGPKYKTWCNICLGIFLICIISMISFLGIVIHDIRSIKGSSTRIQNIGNKLQNDLE